MSAPLRPSYESELEARIAELEAEVTRLSEALDGALAADWSSLRETLARQEEREACARIAEHEAEVNHAEGRYIADIIRARPAP